MKILNFKLKINLKSTCLVLPLFLLVLPVSETYRLDSFGFGGGGEASMSSQTYSLEGILGETTASQSSETYGARSGLLFMQMTNVPQAPALTNPSNWYNKLKIVINESGNPSDTTYAIAISDDNWATAARWVQNDNTIRSDLGFEDYQTYAEWGGATGENIINLTPNKTYHVRVKAKQGYYTETGLGPQASAVTSQVTLDFDIDSSSIDEETAAPYSVQFGSLTIATVNTASNKIWVDFATNAEGGGYVYVYVYDTNAGLLSSATNYTITSTSTDLAGATEGFGIRGNSATNLTFIAPYNGASDNVGLVDTTVREILNSSGAPVTAGRASILVKARPSNTTPASSDYTDTITLISSGTF